MAFGRASSSLVGDRSARALRLCVQEIPLSRLVDTTRPTTTARQRQMRFQKECQQKQKTEAQLSFLTKVFLLEELR